MVSIMSSRNPLPSHRLGRLVTLCGAGERLWDIGCDHGLAGLHAGHTRAFKHIQFVDPSSSVIQLLKQRVGADIPRGFSYNILEQRNDQISDILSSDVFLMAGFGGVAIIEGLKNISAQLTSPSRFILSPHKDILSVRRYLFEGPWHLAHEEIIEEAGQFYDALVVENRQGRSVSLYGEEQWASREGQVRLEDLLKKLPLHQNPRDKAYYEYLLSLQKLSNFT